MAPPDKETSKWRGERKEEKEEERDLPSLRYELLPPLSLSFIFIIVLLAPPHPVPT